MTRDKTPSAAAKKMAYEKIISEIDNQLIDLKEKNPNLIEVDEAKKINERFKDKSEIRRAKYNRIQNIIHEIKETETKLKSGLEINKNQIRSDLDGLYSSLDKERRVYNELTQEVENLWRQVEISSSEENRKYANLWIERDNIKKLLEELNKKSLESPIEMQASEKKSSPFGPVYINKNLIENIIKSSDWQKKFSEKNKLEIIKEAKEEKIQFVSKEKNIQIEVNNEKVTGQWKKENEQEGIAWMVELYLKAIETHKIDKHKVEGKNPELTKLIEFELAKQLKARGTNEVEINDKNLDDIIKSNNQNVSEKILQSRH